MRFGKVDISNAKAFKGISKEEFSAKYSRFMRPSEFEKAWEYVQKELKDADRTNATRRTSKKSTEVGDSSSVASSGKRRKRKKASSTSEQGLSAKEEH